MDYGLKDKVALVTGAGSQIGFGKAIALTLAREGCHVAVADLDLPGVEKTAAEIRAMGRNTLAIKADVTSAASVNDMVKAVLVKLKKIDILVNNAGGCSPIKPFIEKGEDEWNWDLDVNLRSVMNCCKAILPGMIKQKYGKIVSITSGAGIHGGMNTSTYAAAKAGIIAFTQSLVSEVARFGINPNCVSPGPAITGFAKNAPPGMLEGFAKMIPIGRLTETQDVANAVAFLVSDVSSDIVGQTLIVTGNVTA
jgi:2-hydroxycyclohexanecarboxyl-CoA dehydrogenase